MVDQTQTDKTIQAVADAAKTTAATVEAVTQTAAPKPVAKTARAPRPRASAAPAPPRPRRRAALARPLPRSSRPPSRPISAPPTTARRTTKAAAAGAANQIERTATMTNDFTQLFAGFQLPGSRQVPGPVRRCRRAQPGPRRQVAQRDREVTDLAKANVEAIAEAGRIAAAGAKSIGQDVIASSRTGFEQASDAIKTLADAKSPTEFFQLQSELVRSSFDRMVSESSKLTEQVVKLAGEAIQPISNRASVNAERVNELMA